MMELFSGDIFINESQAARTLNISRYYVRMSLKEKKIVFNRLNEKCAFVYCSHGMDQKKLLEDFLERDYSIQK